MMITTADQSIARTARFERLERSGIPAARALADILAVITGFELSYQTYAWLVTSGAFDRALPTPGAYRAVAVLFGFLCLPVFAHLGLYSRRVSVLNLWELRTASKGVVQTAAYFFALQFFLRLGSYSRFVVVGAVLVTLALIVLERRLLAAIVGRLQVRGRLGRNVAIIGCGPTGRLLMKKIVQAPHTGYRVVGFLDDSAPVGTLVSCRLTQTGPALFQAPVLGRWADWQAVAAHHGLHELLITDADADPDKLRELFRLAREQRIRVGVVPHLDEVRADELQVEDLSAIPVLRPYAAQSSRSDVPLKHVMDLLGALLLLVLTAPLWALAALAIRLDSPGPILFVQERVGVHGRRFRIFKFRTMRADADPYAHSPQGDDEGRITRVGRILRTAGFDELPQLLNVLRGEMSLVGPRPEMPFIVEGYSPLERQRLQVKPGITGLWQLSADRHAEIHENIEYDLYYVRHHSIVMDVLILLETVFFTIGVIAAAMRRRTAQDRRPAKLPREWEHADEPYVLVALDQRRNGTAPAIWLLLLPAVFGICARWPVKLLVAKENIPAYDQLLLETVGSPAAEQYRPMYVPYHGRVGLRSLIAGARLVITDLPHVTPWVVEAGKDLVAIDDDDLRWPDPSTSAEEIVQALSRAMTSGDAHRLPSTLGVGGEAHYTS